MAYYPETSDQGAVVPKSNFKGASRQIVPLASNAYKFPNSQFSQETLINWYPSLGNAQFGGKYDTIYLPTPGLTSSINITSQLTPTVRWGASINGVSYAIVGNGFFSLNHHLQSWTLIGNLNTSTGIVRHVYNNFQVFLCDGQYGYVYQLTDSTNSQGLTPGEFAVITDTHFNSNAIPFVCCELQGYGIYVIPGSNNFQVGTLNDFTSWPVTYESTFQFIGDNLVACVATHLDLWLFGETRTEVLQNQPNSSTPDVQPFTPIQGVLIEKGCAAQYSPCLLNNSIFWLSANEQGGFEVVTVTGQYVATTVSTKPLSIEWSTYDTVTDAIGFGIFYQGEPMYVLTFPTANKTWVYCVNQGRWFQWASINSNGQYQRHLTNAYWFYNNTPYVGDVNSANIYELDPNNFTENGTTILREMTLPTFVNNLKKTSISQLWVDCEVGRGTSTGQGLNPRLMLTTSGDGGFTWTPEKLGNLGSIGQYNTHCHWYRLGTKRQMTIRLRLSDPIYCALFAAYLEVISGMS